MSLRCRNNEGQTLVEMVFALGVAVLVIVALVAATTVAVRNAQFARSESLAVKYAQEGMENMRVYRDASWTVFWAAANGINYGLSESTPSGPCPSTPNLVNIFIRCVKLEQAGTDKVKTTVTVSWTDAKGTHSSTQISYFTNWQ